jgi:Tfp pilus assembly protein PilN
MNGMNALALNFVRQRRYVSPLGLMLLAAGLLSAALVAQDFLEAQAELQRTQQHQARLQRTLQAPRSRVAARPASREDANVVGSVATQLNLPWNALLNEIDLLVDPAVVVLSVEAQGQSHSLRLTGEAREMTDVVAYMRRLRKSPSIESAYLSHHEERQAGAAKLIRFSLDAKWRSAL